MSQSPLCPCVRLLCSTSLHSILACQHSAKHDLSPLQGVVYTKSLQTGWKPKAKYRAMREEAHQDFRDKFHIICEGDNLPPPVCDLPCRCTNSCKACN